MYKMIYIFGDSHANFNFRNLKYTNCNGSSNIYKIAYQAIHKLERPDYLCRTTSNQNTSTSVYKQNIHMV